MERPLVSASGSCIFWVWRIELTAQLEIGFSSTSTYRSTSNRRGNHNPKKRWFCFSDLQKNFQILIGWPRWFGSLWAGTVNPLLYLSHRVDTLLAKSVLWKAILGSSCPRFFCWVSERSWANPGVFRRGRAETCMLGCFLSLIERIFERLPMSYFRG